MISKQVMQAYEGVMDEMILAVEQDGEAEGTAAARSEEVDLTKYEEEAVDDFAEPAHKARFRPGSAYRN